VLGRTYSDAVNCWLRPIFFRKAREAMWFERCRLRRDNKSIRALIIRTSTDYHGFSMLEIMAECDLRDFFSLKDGDEVQVEVFDSFDEAETATKA
jgi:hypothetical protein